MNLSIEFNQAEIKSSFDWQLVQEVNVKNEQGETIAKAEIELLTINKHRNALKSYQQLDSDEGTDWEIPLNLYFKGHNLTTDLCTKFAIKTEDKKATQHIMIEAISVLPDYRKQGVAKYLLQAIATQYNKAQSINVMSMPMQWFVDVEHCETEESKSYYQAMGLDNNIIEKDALKQFFTQMGFIDFQVDASLLAEPLQYDIFIGTPDRLLSL